MMPKPYLEKESNESMINFSEDQNRKSVSENPDLETNAKKEAALLDKECRETRP